MTSNIIQLQNHYTTPEQSTRLLELGVPEWTADCVLRHYNWAEDNLNENNWEYPCIQAFGYEGNLDRFLDDEYDKVLPCWSAGRLEEIFVKARGYEDGMMSINGRNTIDYLIGLFAMPREDRFKLDFSKLYVNKETTD